MHAPMPETERRSWLRLALTPGLRPRAGHQLLAAFGLPQRVFAASPGARARIVGAELAAQLGPVPTAATQRAIDGALRWLEHDGHHLLTLADAAYPRALLDLADAPLGLYAHGALQRLRHPMVALVGSRAATPEGEENALAFARHLAQRGWCVVSGLASGIDGAAHRGALAAGPAGGGTVAVLGTGVDVVYPPRQRELAAHIAQGGLLLSEFALGTPARRFHFPRRNRLVAALAQGVLVVQAAARSGSLITAQLAAELGREVFAIPGSIHSPLTRGCHALIRQGAKLVECGQDLLDELQAPPLPGLFPTAGRAQATAAEHGSATEAPAAATPGPAQGPDPLLAKMGHEPVTLDALVARTGRPVPELMAALSRLELAGQIVRDPDGRHRRRP